MKTTSCLGFVLLAPPTTLALMRVRALVTSSPEAKQVRPAPRGVQEVPTMSSPMPVPYKTMEPYAHSHHQSPVPRPSKKALLGRP